MSGNEEDVNDLQSITDLLKEHDECLATIERATNRKTAIELRLSTVREALDRLEVQRFGAVRKPRGRPRKVVDNIIEQHYGEHGTSAGAWPEDDGNTAA